MCKASTDEPGARIGAPLGAVREGIACKNLRRHHDSAEALSACRAAKVPKGPLLRHLTEDPSSAPALLRSFAGCAEEREAAVERLLDREVGRRLARLLLELAGRFGEGEGGVTQVRTRLSHYDL